MSCYTCFSAAAHCCQQCCKAKYCSKKCQQSDWDVHQHECFANGDKREREDEDSKSKKRRKLNYEEIKATVIELYAQIQSIEKYSKMLAKLKERYNFAEKKLEELAKMKEEDSEEVEFDEQEEEEWLQKKESLENQIRLPQILLNQANLSFAENLDNIPEQSKRQVFHAMRPGTKTSVLTRAIYTKLPALVTMLLSKGGRNVYISSDDLKLAVDLNATRILRALLDKRMPPDAFGALLIALKARKIEIAKMFIEKDIKLDGHAFISELEEYFVADETEMFDLTASAYSAQFLGMFLVKVIPQKNVALVKALLERGAEIDEQFRGKTAIEQAALDGNVEIFRLLVENGADIRQKYSDNNQSLMFKVAKNYDGVEIARFLISRGFNVDEKDDGGTPVLFKARDAMLRLLLDNGADVNARDKNGATLLHRTSDAGLTSTSEILIEYGADVKAKDNAGRIPIDSAIEGVDDDGIIFLLKHNGVEDVEKTLFRIVRAEVEDFEKIFRVFVENFETELLETVGEDGRTRLKRVIDRLNEGRYQHGQQGGLWGLGGRIRLLENYNDAVDS